MQKTKICSKCNQELNILNFSKLSRSKDGYNYSCKECINSYRNSFLERTGYYEKYHTKYYQENKERILKRSALWKKENSVRKRLLDKEWSKINKDRIAAKNKKWYQENKEYVLNEARKYRTRNQEHRSQVNKKWLQNNRDRRLQYMKMPQNRIAHNLRSRVYNIIKNGQKAGSAVSDLGCSINKLKIYLQLKFHRNPRNKHEYMTWDNYGEWHIDHIRPLSSFDLSSREELLKAYNYTNLQPLWAEDNIKKHDKYVEDKK